MEIIGMESKMSTATSIMNEIVTRLLDSDRILLLCHVAPDGDCVGSLLALGRALKKLGKDVVMACEDKIPSSLKFLVEAGELILTTEISGSFDVAVAVDSGDGHRLGSLGLELFEKQKITINIDHHGSNPSYGDINYIDSTKAATGEIIMDLIEYLDVKIDSALATPLYTAIFTDTGGFRFSNTTSDTLKRAAALVEFGAEPALISSEIYENKPLAYFKMLSDVFERFIVDGKILYTWVKVAEVEELGLDYGATEELSTFTKMVEGIEVAIVFKEQKEDLVKVSFRSKGSFDVANLADKFGGGGHRQAAGCTINDSLEAAINLVLNISRKEMGQKEE